MLLSAVMANQPHFDLLSRHRRAVDYCNIKTCAPPYKDNVKKTDHTLCKKGYKVGSTGPKCKGASPIALSSGDKTTIVNLHNSLRSKVALGKLNGQPKATNMRKLKWDNDLEMLAKAWVNQCINDHDKCNDLDRFQVGQNMAEREGSQSISSMMVDSINDWFSEHKKFNKAWVAGAWSSRSGSIGHYTQVVWANTYLVGCAPIRFKVGKATKNHFFCNYGPAGNMGSEAVYKTGTKPASNCPRGTKANTATGLCE